MGTIKMLNGATYIELKRKVIERIRNEIFLLYT